MTYNYDVKLNAAYVARGRNDNDPNSLSTAEIQTRLIGIKLQLKNKNLSDLERQKLLLEKEKLEAILNKRLKDSLKQEIQDKNNRSDKGFNLYA